MTALPSSSQASEYLSRAETIVNDEDRPERVSFWKRSSLDLRGAEPNLLLCQSIPISSASIRIVKSTHVYVKESSVPDQQSLDLYRPSNAKPGSNLPMVVYVHGGGFAKGDKGNTKGHDKSFPTAGYLLASVNYRLSDTTPGPGTGGAMYPEHVKDVAAAIAWLYYNAEKIGGDRNRIFLMGHSAGAALVSLVATDNQFLNKYGVPFSAIRGVIALDGGSFDLAKRASRPRSRAIIENAYGTNRDLWRIASPINHVRSGKNIPPFFLNFTTKPKEELAMDFAAKLKGAGIDVVVFPTIGRGHEEVNFAVSKSGDPLNRAVFKFIADRDGGGNQASAVENEDRLSGGIPVTVADPMPPRRRLAAARNFLRGTF